MPKMSEAFYTQKREEILDTAQRIALEKPLPHVSMTDLIRASGVSQGAIYHYFSSLDEIWLGLVNRFYQTDDLLTHLRQVFLQTLSPRETMCRCLWELCENLRRTVPVYGKLVLELNTLVQANPNRYSVMLNTGKTHGRLEDMLSLFETWAQEQIQSGTVRPRVSWEQLSMSLSSSYLGLRYHAAVMHLQPALSNAGLDEYLNLQLESWEKSFLYLMGLDRV